MRVTFEIFEENSSSTEAIVDFAIGRLTFPALRDEMWDKRAKVEVEKMKRLGRKKALTLSQLWCTRRGYDYSCEC